MRFRPRSDKPPREEELAALADGSLPAGRRAELEASVRDSPELAAELAEQQRALTLIQGAGAETEAPMALRARIERERLERRTAQTPNRRLLWAGGLATAGAAAVLALLLALPGNVPGGPSLAEAAVLASRPATEPAPAPRPSEPTLLARQVDGVPFPNWRGEFGWRVTGARDDMLRGRRVTTVFYDKGGRRVGYSIVAGDALPIPGKAREVQRGGTDLRVFRSGGRWVVTWQRLGRTCVLSAERLSAATLIKLAVWKGGGTVPF